MYNETMTNEERRQELQKRFGQCMHTVQQMGHALKLLSPNTRESSLAKTKLDEMQMWLQRDFDNRMKEIRD